MNIKRAKEEIEHTVRAYLAKDALGEYAIPAIRQRPILPARAPWACPSSASATTEAGTSR